MPLARFLALFASVLAALTLAADAYFIARGYSGVLFWDQWTVYQCLEHVGSSWRAFIEGWSGHAGHRMALPYMVDWWNARAFAWNLRPLLALGIALHAALTVLLVRLARSSRHRIALSAAIVAVLWNPAQMENLVWSMQFSYYLTFTSAALALYANARERPGLSMLAALSASLSMINGLLAWPALYPAMSRHPCELEAHRRFVRRGCHRLGGLFPCARLQ